MHTDHNFCAASYTVRFTLHWSISVTSSWLLI